MRATSQFKQIQAIAESELWVSNRSSSGSKKPVNSSNKERTVGISQSIFRFQETSQFKQIQAIKSELWGASDGTSLDSKKPVNSSNRERTVGVSQNREHLQIPRNQSIQAIKSKLWVSAGTSSDSKKPVNSSRANCRRQPELRASSDSEKPVNSSNRERTVGISQNREHLQIPRNQSIQANSSKNRERTEGIRRNIFRFRETSQFNSKKPVNSSNREPTVGISRNRDASSDSKKPVNSSNRERTVGVSQNQEHLQIPRNQSIQANSSNKERTVGGVRWNIFRFQETSQFKQ
eukprot:scaffold341_cov67-Cylindrotheca_fusiformis.AAC.2